MNLQFVPARTDRSPMTVLCLGAHSDDIEIGCGASIIKLVRSRVRVNIVWIVFSGDRQRAHEARASARLFLQRTASARVELHDFRESYFPTHVGEIKDVFEELKTTTKPDLIFTHTAKDTHQDHRVLCELTWNTFRSHTILEYEIPKYDGDTGSPNVFIELDRKLIDIKTRYLMRCFATQRDRHWFTGETFLGLARLRGIQCAAPGGFAEAFYGRKLSIL